MKNLLTGLILGAVAAWFWYHSPAGKIGITETKVITNIVTETKTETVTLIVTNITEQIAYVVKTNEVWKTNIVEKLVMSSAPVQPVTPQPIVQAQPAQSSASPAITSAPPVRGLGGSRKVSGGVKWVDTINRPVKSTKTDAHKKIGED